MKETQKPKPFYPLILPGKSLPPGLLDAPNQLMPDCLPPLSLDAFITPSLLPVEGFPISNSFISSACCRPACSGDCMKSSVTLRRFLVCLMCFSSLLLPTPRLPCLPLLWFSSLPAPHPPPCLPPFLPFPVLRDFCVSAPSFCRLFHLACHPSVSLHSSPVSPAHLWLSRYSSDRC